MGHQTQNWVKVAELSEVTEGSTESRSSPMGWEGVALPSLTLTDGFTQRITSVHTWVIR